MATFRGKKRIDLFLEIDRDGNVTDVIAFGPWVTCGKNDETADTFQQVAVEAAKKTVFSPARRDGKAIDGYTTMSYLLIGTKPALPQRMRKTIVVAP